MHTKNARAVRFYLHTRNIDHLGLPIFEHSRVQMDHVWMKSKQFHDRFASLAMRSAIVWRSFNGVVNLSV